MKRRFVYLLIALAVVLCGGDLRAQRGSVIRFEDSLDRSGIDFVHYAPRPRWCEIGPTVQGVATNEGLNLVFEEEREYWKSGGRLLTM